MGLPKEIIAHGKTGFVCHRWKMIEGDSSGNATRPADLSRLRFKPL